MNDISDHVEKIGRSLIQHDKLNDRIYLMKTCESDYAYLIEVLEEMAERGSYTKIIGKVPFSSKAFFIEKDYYIEAVVPELYNSEDGLFIAKYLSKERKIEKFKQTVDEVLNKACKKEGKVLPCILSEEFTYREIKKEDASAIAKFYKDIFKTYPFPIDKEEYILKNMKDNVIYFTIWRGKELISASATEIDYENSNVEMTDFGTLYDYRGKGFADYLLRKMEEKMIKKGIKVAYTIARSLSYGMNMVFSKNDYTFGGTLTNNTNISGKVESMNVWYKKLI